MKSAYQQLPKTYPRRSAQIPALLVKPVDDPIEIKADCSAMHRLAPSACAATAEIATGTGRNFDQAFERGNRWHQKQNIRGISPRIT